MTEAPSASPLKDIDLGGYISKAWKLVTADLMLFVVGYLVCVAIVVGSLIVIIGPIFVTGPLAIGFIRVVQRRMNGEPAVIGDIFAGFKEFSRGLVFVLLLLVVGLAVAIPLMIVAFVLAFIPCLGQIVTFVLQLAVSLGLNTVLFFAWPLVSLSANSPMDCIKKSITFGFAHFWPLLILSFVTHLIGGAGFVACGVGILFTAPLAIAITLVAYKEFYLPKSQVAA
ncbi:MAG: hypothetical protein NTU94_03000 [Planctomycetota bacterium]|nr:hypothetical protein [Planctomycetota bacterium]